MSTKISTQNWNIAQYQSDNLLAFISIGAGPATEASAVEIQYHVTLSNTDYEELFQSSHGSLEEAVETLNLKYGDWKFNSLMKEASDSGCSTCAAH
jgi:hypothetical protein